MKFQRSRIISSIIFAVIAVPLLVYAVKMTTTFPRWLVDDSFILFRYAENLVEHGELNWNPGENPTEGYTGIAQIMLIAAAMRFGVSPITATHAIGIAAFFLGAALLILILRGFNLGSVTALALYLAAPFIYAHVWSGLETMLFSTSILFAVYTATQHRNRLFVTALFLLSFSRPEGALLALILLAGYRPFSMRLALWYLVPGAVYFIWRFAYYGQLLPNTFFAKALAGDSPKENLDMMRSFFTTFLSTPSLLALIFIRWKAMKEHLYVIIGVFAFSLTALYVYFSSYLAMNFVFRFLVPFYIIATLAIGAIMAATRLSIRSAAITLVLIVPWVLQCTSEKYIKDYRWYCRTHYQMLKDEHIKLGTYLNENLPPEEWLIVHIDAGSVPYYSKRKTVDFGRLNDEYLARERPDMPDLVDYFYSHNAGALVFTSRNMNTLKHSDQSDAIHKDPRFNNYTLVKKYRSNARRDYFEFLYVRNDLLERMGLESKKTGEHNDAPRAKATRIETLSPDSIWEKAQSEKTPLARIQLYRRLLQEYPHYEHTPHALFMIGFIYSEDLNNENEARNTYRELIKRYPDHEIVESAKWMLKNMDKAEPPVDKDG